MDRKIVYGKKCDPRMLSAPALGQLRSPMHLNGKNRKISFNGRKLARNEQMDRKFMFMKIFWAQGVVYPCTGAICMYMTIIFKHLLL